MQESVIRKLRKKKGYTQQELGTKLNVNPRQVRRWEALHQAPKITNLRAICKVLGLPKEQMYKIVYNYRKEV